ncbi:MAG: nucleotidyltransferase domain-containing protein [Candidatus Sericytochromatia bacterium]|nr:nucleotidyltransferase domain-containing protein [Candidatus Tanganyikabacteria bacterium]
MGDEAEGASRRLGPDVLDAIVARVVRAAEPERVILFGSAARGSMGPNSDVDLLVVKAGQYDKWRVMDDIYHSLLGVGQAVDVVVVTPEEVERYGRTHCLVIKPALEEGRVVYGA